MAKYEAPQINKKSFTCIYCDTLSQQEWYYSDVSSKGYFGCSGIGEFRLSTSTCNACNGKIIWKDNKIIEPKSSIAPVALEEMPEVVKSIYNEAATVVSDSPRSACALLRLAIENLCTDLVPSGNLNTKIGKMVEQGLDVRVQKALDVVRITGNDKIHPGQISEVDTIEVAKSMFELVNFIVDKLIIQPSKIDNMFSGLPEEKKEQIKKRDIQKVEV